MLRELYGKVHAWLEANGLTAWAEDTVPEGTGFPFITCRIETPLAGLEGGLLTLTCWHRGRTAHADRLAMADRLNALVPTGGVVLKLTGGLATVTRADEQAVPCCGKGGAMGMSIRFRLRVYGLYQS